jgi:hypothetical protein
MVTGNSNASGALILVKLCSALGATRPLAQSGVPTPDSGSTANLETL